MKNQRFNQRINALRDEQKTLKQELRTELSHIFKQYQRKAATLICFGIAYMIVSNLLQQSKKKSCQKTPQQAAPKASSHPSKSPFMRQLLNTLIDMLISKGTSQPIKKLTPYLTKGQGGWIVSLILTVLPWGLRKLFSTLGRKS